MGQIDGGGRAATARGVTIDTPVRHVDLLPTMLEAVGAPTANGPGVSLAPLVAGGSGADRPSYFEAMSATLARGWAPLRGVIVGREKFIDLPIAELYDLGTYRKEAQNLFATKPERAQVLLNTLKSFNVAPRDGRWRNRLKRSNGCGRSATSAAVPAPCGSSSPTRTIRNA